MGDTRLVLPPKIQAFLRKTIQDTGGNEVFFLARLAWSMDGEEKVATVDDVEVLARGNRTSVLAITERADGWDLAIHNHPGGQLEPSEADFAIASALADRSVGFAIISNDASRLYLAVSPFPREAKPVLVDPDEVRAIFAPGGVLAQGIDGFESRPEQVEMALEVARALNEDRILAAEAGTGVGKSLAYLVPSILWAVRNRERVVVATGTINLQEQLVGKDLPCLAKLLPLKFRFALIKGRNNYACRRKLEEVAADLAQKDAFPGDDARQLRELMEWSRTTRDGSRSDLSWVPPHPVWEEVMSETDKSLKAKCKHYGECFYYQAKRQADKADVIVANHHLFFADLSVRRELENFKDSIVLPAYRRVIFDEAHHLEDVATEYFGVQFTRSGILTRLSRLISPKHGERGSIPTLVRRLRTLGDPIAAGAIERAFQTVVPEVRERVEHLFDELEQEIQLSEAEGCFGKAGGRSESSPPVLREAPAGIAATGGESEPQAAAIQVRYTGEAGAEAFWQGLQETLSDVKKELASLLKVTDRALATLERSRISEEAIEAQSLELTSFSSRLQGLIVHMDRYLDLDDDSQVRWLALRQARRRRERASLEFVAAPIRVSASLKGAVYDTLKTVILSSATLSVAGRLEFLAGRLGLDELGPERFDFREHGSPFDFPSQAVTVVPTDIALPESRQFRAEATEAVYRIVRAAGGRAFVLFTSYSFLQSAYRALEGRLVELGLRPSAQGEAGRSELLDRFRSGASNVLFGTDSFWEGVDVKGKALECVILTRLPFRVPSEPIQEARLEDIEARGENPFTSFTVPQAVLKLKQGFGRLIRSKTDRGIVAILDRRILTKPYGRVFLDSLPRAALLKAPLDQVVRRVEEFFAREEPPASAPVSAAPPRRIAPAASPVRPVRRLPPWENGQREEPAGPRSPPW